jgi:Mrp family chromosome partitioning ATPase
MRNQLNPLTMIKRIPKIVVIVGLLALIALSVFNKSIIETLENKNTNTNPKKKYMEVIMWLDYSGNSSLTPFALESWMQFETIYKNNAQVIIEKRDMKGVITWFKTIPEFAKAIAEAKKKNPKVEEEQQAFMNALSPYVSFSVLDKTKGETLSSGALRSGVGGVGASATFAGLDATFKALMGVHKINVEP